MCEGFEVKYHFGHMVIMFRVVGMVSNHNDNGNTIHKDRPLSFECAGMSQNVSDAAKALIKFVCVSKCQEKEGKQRGGSLWINVVY